MNEERLKTLLKQKELLAEHVAWLDEEIAKAKQANRIEPADEPPPAFPGYERKRALDLDPESRSTSEAAADIYTTLGPESHRSASDARRGCVWLFAIGFILIGCAIAATYLYYGD